MRCTGMSPCSRAGQKGVRRFISSAIMVVTGDS
jgi:hypothetical protein